MTPRKIQCYHSDSLGVALTALSRTELFKQQNGVLRKFVFSFAWFLCLKKWRKASICQLFTILTVFILLHYSCFIGLMKAAGIKCLIARFIWFYFSPKNVLIRFLFEESMVGFVHRKRLSLLFSSMCFSFVYTYSEKLYLIH